MQKYQDVVLSQNGNPVQGAQITVTNLSGTPVPAYGSDVVGVDVNPVQSDVNGRFFFYAPDGRYNLVVRLGGAIVATITDILLEDPSDAAITGGTINATSIGATTPSTGAFTTLADSGNLTFTGTGNRITGDFSNATIANRVMFQSSTVNGATSISAIPNGTGAQADLFVFNGPDPNNASFAYLRAMSTAVILNSGITGTGTYLPMTFFTGGSERMRIDTSGNVLVTNAAGLGYGTGAGGTVTQATSKSTAVTMTPARPSGQITMNNAALAASTTAAFTFNNSILATTDTLIVNSSFSSSYQVWAAQPSAGATTILIRNITGGSLSDAVVINFAIIKGATS